MNLIATGAVTVGVRPEDVRLESAGRAARVESIEYLGADSLVAARHEGQVVLARVSGKPAVAAGDPVHLAWDKSNEHLFDSRTGGKTP